jgi:hypothetical protein
MKNKLLFFILLLLCGCNPVAPKKVSIKKQCLHLYMVDGRTRDVAFFIPTTSKFKIETSRGSYWLEARDAEGYFHNYKSGVIDFDIIKCP